MTKSRKCIAAGCPLAKSKDARCEHCTGPVVWIGEDGTGRGRPRSCHSCPMNGLGLPVCWAACPGPNEGFGTDGQSLVTTGGMEAPNEFIERYARRPNPKGRDERITATLSKDGEEAALSLARRISDFDGRTWSEFIAAFSKGAEGRREAARIARLPPDSFDDDGSPQCRMVKAMSCLDGEDFCILRRRIESANCSQTARSMLVTKQAVSKRERRIRAKAEWYGRFVRSADENGDAVFSETEGDITPADSGRRTPE